MNEKNSTAVNSTNVVFRCSDGFKDKIEAWAASHKLNISEACRNLINLELNREESLIEAVEYGTEYSRFLQSIGYINAKVPSEKLEEVAAQYAEYLRGGKREFA